jgi:hypothetical protein
MSRRREYVELPKDCEKLSPSACTSWKTKDRKTGVSKCKIKYSKLGFANKCVENDNYEFEKFIFEEGFEDFATIGEGDLDRELKLRNKICENLNTDTCRTELGKKLGCKVKKRLLSPDSCRLDPKLIEFLKKRELLCEIEDCKELKKKGILCQKCVDELDEMLQEYNGLYTLLSKRKNPAPEDVKRFFILADEIKDEWYSYFVTGQKKLLDEIEKKRMRIEELHGGARCQAFNITTCIGKGEVLKQCKCKGIRTSVGLFCGTHRNCYERRVGKFNEFRDKFDELCREKELCRGIIKEMKQFYEMIKYTTYGDAKNKKVEVDNILDFAEEYMTYIEN